MGWGRIERERVSFVVGRGDVYNYRQGKRGERERENNIELSADNKWKRMEGEMS